MISNTDININFERTKKDEKCDCCGLDIAETAPMFEVEVGEDIKFKLCEDCGLHLSDDISEEHSNAISRGRI